jgi:hypothetical protein
MKKVARCTLLHVQLFCYSLINTTESIGLHKLVWTFQRLSWTARLEMLQMQIHKLSKNWWYYESIIDMYAASVNCTFQKSRERRKVASILHMWQGSSAFIVNHCSRNDVALGECQPVLRVRVLRLPKVWSFWDERLWAQSRYTRLQSCQKCEGPTDPA